MRLSNLGLPAQRRLAHPWRRYLALARLSWMPDGVLPSMLHADADGMRQFLSIQSLRDATAAVARVDTRTARVATTLRLLGPLGPGAWSERLAPADGTPNLLEALRIGPAVLALPLHPAALGALGKLLHGHGGPVLVQRTPLSNLLLDPAIGAERPLAQLVSDREMIQRSRSTATIAPHTLWVTFPDHHGAARIGCQLAVLCEQPHYFTLLEFILATRCRAPVWTMDRLADRFIVQPCLPSASTLAQPAGNEAVSALYDALAAALTRVLRHDPEALLSWSRIDRNAARSLARRDIARVSTLRELVRGWRTMSTHTGNAGDIATSLDALDGALRTTRLDETRLIAG